MNGISRLRGALLLVLLGLAAIGTPARAQIEANLSSYTGPNAKGYLNPLKEGFGAALNCGTFRSAQIPRMGFNFSFEIKSMFVKYSDSDRSFMAQTEAGFNPSTTVEAPTVIGSPDYVAVTGQGGSVAAFPGGFDVGSIGLATPQVTIGSIMGTQAVIRWISVDTQNSEIGKVKFWGAGARHSISQYLPGLPLDLAANFFYQSFKLGDGLIDAKATTTGVQASKKFAILEPFAGLGVDTFAMSTKYTTKNTNPPVALDVDFGTDSNLHETIGVNLNLLVLHLTAAIDHSSQTSYGLGLSLGN